MTSATSVCSLWTRTVTDCFGAVNAAVDPPIKGKAALSMLSMATIWHKLTTQCRNSAKMKGSKGVILHHVHLFVWKKLKHPYSTFPVAQFVIGPIPSPNLNRLCDVNVNTEQTDNGALNYLLTYLLVWQMLTRMNIRWLSYRSLERTER